MAVIRNLKRLGLSLTERKFVIATVVCIVLTRLITIALTPHSANYNDILGYQATGQAVLAGINPYKFDDQPALRETMRSRLNKLTADPEAKESLASWNYYISSNLPAVALWSATLEVIAHGSRLAWRLLLILGDLAIFFGLMAFFRFMPGGTTDGRNRIGIFCLSVIYPVLIVDGTAIPEEKQFQTALMFYAAALLLSDKPISTLRGLASGITLSLSVLFMFFGAFLFPLWLKKAITDWPKYFLLTVLGGLVPIAVSLAVFGPYFIFTIAGRAQREGGDIAEHASIWTLLPVHAAGVVMIAKVISVVTLCSGLAFLLVKKRIDLLNFSAALCMIYATLWLSRGAMNRENIAIMFSIACLATASQAKFLFNAVFAVVASGFVYLGFGVLKLAAHVEMQFDRIQAILALVLISAYLVTLVSMGVRPRDSELRQV